MTGDDYGLTVGMATLLVRALDGLLGTYNIPATRRPGREPEPGGGQLHLEAAD
jgi:hypothetical protein